jgi:hypothetical protein
VHFIAAIYEYPPRCASFYAPRAMKRLRYFFLVTDVGFIAYWLVTLAAVVPDSYLFKDYHNPILHAWNWSFLPLDLMISFTGLVSLYLLKRNNPAWHGLALTSLVLTFCSGLQAVSFWAIRRDFDISWWLPNLYLLLYPLFFIPGFLKSTK